MPGAARRTLAQACARHGVPVIEDDVYGELAFDGSRPAPLMSYDEADNAILCGSASKIIGPGLRMGWAVSPRWREALLRAKAFTSIAANTLAQHVTAELLSGANLERPLRRLRGGLRSQRGALPRIDRSPLAGRHVRLAATRRPGAVGPAAVRIRRAGAVRARRRCRHRHHPRQLPSASGAYRDCVRLSCATAWDARVEQALKTLGRLAHG